MRADRLADEEPFKTMNPAIKAVGEIVLRVRDLEAVKKFYADVIGLDILREFEGIAFLRVAAGHGGHTQIVGLFRDSLPDPFGERRGSVDPGGTSLHHFALEIDKSDYEKELRRLQGFGVEITTFEHRWCHWRSIYVKDPEGNVVELVCFDESVR